MATSSSNLKESSLFQHLSNRREGYYMKKSLSLLAIVCLLLSMGLVSQVLANAPVYPEVPSVKLFTNNVGLTPAFDLAWFNNAPDGFAGDAATAYSITANFLGNVSLSSSTFSNLNSDVNEGGYSAATDGVNTFSMANAGGSVAVSNKAKYSTYILDELPKVGLNPGESVTIPLSSYNSAGAAAAPSFGNANALIVSDATQVAAAWANGNTAVTITASATATEPSWVDVIASPVATGAIGVDQDKERVYVYLNLLANGTFNTSSDTAAWGLENAAGAQWANMASQTWVASTTDGAGNVANGVWVFSATNNSYGVKATPFGNYIPMAAGNWYIARMNVADPTPGNTDQTDLYAFSTAASAGATADISADIFVVSTPTTWTWMEAPFYVHANNTGFPQFEFKAGGAGSLFIDEIQVIKATPKILDGNRGNVRSFVSGGLFTNAASTAKWGAEIYSDSNATLPPVIETDDTLIGSAISVNFAGAAPGAGNYKGFKWTYGSGGTLNNPAVTVGREGGATMQMDVVSGLSGPSELNQALIAAYGTGSNSDAAIEHLDAAAIVGSMIAGENTLQTVGVQVYPYTQLQFGFRADGTGVVNFANVDVINDNNDPNFGNEALFP